jgi:hypothetical protein
VAVLGRAALQQNDHCFEDHLVSSLRILITARNVAWQSYHRTGIFDFVEMLPGQVSADDLRPGIFGGQVDMHTLPAAIPFWVGEEAFQHLGVQIAFAREVPIEAAMGETSVGHDLLDRDAIKSKSVE